MNLAVESSDSVHLRSLPPPDQFLWGWAADAGRLIAVADASVFLMLTALLVGNGSMPGAGS